MKDHILISHTATDTHSHSYIHSNIYENTFQSNTESVKMVDCHVILTQLNLATSSYTKIWYTKNILLIHTLQNKYS